MMGVSWFSLLISLISLNDPGVDLDWNPKILRIVSDFEDTTGVTFPPPRLVSLPESEFRREVESITGGVLRKEDQESQPYLELLYDPVGNRILRLEGGRRVENLAKNAGEIPGIEQLLLVHETAHAWQKQVLRERLARGLWSSVVSAAMLEGHADWMTGEFAGRHRLETEFKRIREGRQQGKHAVGRMNSYFLYHESFEFWRYMSRHQPAVGLPEVWQKPPTERQVIYPKEYGTPVPLLSLDASVNVLDLDATDPLPEPQELGFLAFRKYAATLAMPDSFKAEAIGDFLHGVRFRARQQQISVLAFAKVDTAHLCFQYTLMQLRRRVQEEELVGTSMASKGMTVSSHRLRGVEPRTTCLIHDGRILMEINDDRSDSQRISLKDWTVPIITRFTAQRDKLIPTTQSAKAIGGHP